MTYTGGSSYTVPVGKTFKIQNLTAACRGGGASPQATAATLTFYANSVQQGQSYQAACPNSTTATAVTFGALPSIFPNGLDFKPGTVFSFTISTSAWSATNTPILDLTLYGYEF